MRTKEINLAEAKIRRKQGYIIYCDYCQHDLRTWGLLCHDSKKQVNFYHNYFIIIEETAKY